MLEKGYGFKPHYKILGYKNIDQLKAKIKPWSSRLTKDEALDLPPKIYERWQVEHTPEQERMYKELKETALTQYSAGMITAVSAMTMMMKLHQINCGHVKLNPTDDEEDGQTVDIPSNRVTELLNVLSKVNGKVIIWACFQRDFDLIGEALTKEYGRDSWVDYHGRTTQTQRPINLDLFIKNEKTRFFLSNPATGGRSITLTVASYAVYYSYNWRLALRLQSEDRDHRKGQTKSCTYVDLCIPKTIDVKILASHKRKKDLASMILDNFGVLLNDDTKEIEATSQQ
jgi:SNF2 family DNA or RNA helicase